MTNTSERWIPRGRAWFARRFLPLGLGLQIATSVGPAWAHEPAPAARQLLAENSPGGRLWMRAPYGILTSEDGAKTWDWICEPAVGYTGGQDHRLAATLDGNVFVAADQGLFATSDHGCAWHAIQSIGNVSVLDVAVESDGRHVLALAQIPEADHYSLVAYRSDAQSEHFSALGDPISDDLLGETLQPAPSDPSRIYVTGTVLSFAAASDAGSAPGDVSAVLLRSRDAGKTWQRVPIPGASSENPPFLAAVHPTNPDIVYVRVKGESRSTGTIESSLLYTEDAGDNWTEIFSAPADILGFSLSEDGSEVLVGLGDSQDPSGERAVDPNALGIYRATAPSFSFTQVRSGHVGCLTRTASGLFVCGNQASNEFELAVSQDDGATVSSVLKLGDVRGPLDCKNAPTVCDRQWPNACASLGSCVASPGGAVADGAVPSPAADNGCGCKLVGSSRGVKRGAWAELIASAAVVFVFFRRRKSAMGGSSGPSARLLGG